MVQLLTPPSSAIRAAATSETIPSPVRREQRPAVFERRVALGSAAMMLVTGLWGVDRGSTWQDEQVTIEVAHRSLAQIVAMLGNVDVVHGLYYCFMHLWMLAGGGEVWARVPSILAMALAGGAVGALGVRLAGVRVGWVAGVLFAASPLVSSYAQEARSYALVCAAVMIATLALVRMLVSGGRRWWLAYAVAMLVAVLLHEFAVLVLLAHATTLLLVGARRPVYVRWLVVALLCGAAVTPLAIVSHRQSGAVDWISPPTAAALLDLAHDLLGVSGWTFWPLTLLTALGTSVAVRGWASRTRETSRSPRLPGLGDVALPLVVVPSAVLLLVSLVKPLFQVRYVVYAEAGIVLVAALGAQVLSTQVVRASRRPALGPRVAAAVVIGLVASQLPAQGLERTPGSRMNDLAAAAAAVREGAQPGDAVVFLPRRFRSVVLAYPDAFAGVEDIALNETPIQADNLRGTDRSRRAVRRAMLDRERIWAIGRPGLAVEADQPGALNEQAVLQLHFRREQVVHVHGMDVALYVRVS